MYELEVKVGLANDAVNEVIKLGVDPGWVDVI
jgi:hypothetical protein